MIETRVGAKGTSATVSYPFATYVSARLLCDDGKVRATKRISQSADTFFSVPCSVVAYGKTVAGYMSVDADADGNQFYVFNAYLYGKNGALITAGPNGPISDSQARCLASVWHGGQYSPSYALCSTGAIVSGVWGEFRRLMTEVEPDLLPDLLALLGYCDTHGERGPQAGWADLRVGM